MTDHSKEFSHLFSLWSRAAIDEGSITAFTTAIERATFFNSSPYVLTFETFARTFGSSRSRASAIEALRRELADLGSRGVRPVCMLAGGSFVDLAATPNDLDCVIFYELSEPSGEPGVTGVLARLGQAGVDARLFPVDISPTFTMKVALFFNNLYASRRSEHGTMKGCLLVEF